MATNITAFFSKTILYIMDLESQLNEIKALLKQVLTVVKDEPIMIPVEELERMSQEKFRAMEEFNKPENIALRQAQSQKP